ncbi:putative cation/H+ exchanger, sodium/solute symporter superfamily [Dioscorea sansibarensis]
MEKRSGVNITLEGKQTTVLYNQTGVKKAFWVCESKQTSNWITSQGYILGDDPINYSLPLLLAESAIIFIVSSAVHLLLKRFNQSKTVSCIIAGILLSPTFLGHSMNIRMILFPPKGTFVLDTISLLSLNLFLFNISVKTDLNMLRKPSMMSIGVGICASLPPLLLSGLLYLGIKETLPLDTKSESLLLLMACRLSLTSFPVIADILDEFGFLNTELGRVATTTSLVSDALAWLLNSFIFASLVPDQFLIKTIMSAVSFGVYLLIVLFILRPTILHIIKKTPVGDLIDEGYFVGVILLALTSALLTELSGYPAPFGPIILGLCLPGGMPLGVSLSEKLDSFVSGLFMPIYLVLAGYRTNLTIIENLHTSLYIGLMILVTVLGKFIGTVLVSLYFRFPLRDAIVMGLMMNLKGIIEVNFFNGWGDAQIANGQEFSALMVSTTVITAISTPLIKYLYKPSVRYVTSKRRTMEHARPNTELKILTAVHNEENVPPILELLEAYYPTSDSPLVIYVLHVMELAGRTTAVLAPHKRSKKSGNTTISDRIVNAFRYYERKNEGSASVLPFIALAPTHTMHNDVCSLSLEKKIRLIILPFHKQCEGPLTMAKQGFQTMNQNVLTYAPCSVAILVDRRHSGGATCTLTNDLLNHVAVFFLGGGDDREALTIGMRIARNSNISLTIVRFISRGDFRELEDEEWKLDNKMMDDLRARQSENVSYKEEVVQDSEETVAIIRAIGNKFDLVIVGRRMGLESSLTSGMSVWSECEELGILGDLLSSEDFGLKASILVVQQQVRAEDQSGVVGVDVASKAKQRTITGILSLNVGMAKQEEARNVLIDRGGTSP